MSNKTSDVETTGAPLALDHTEIASLDLLDPQGVDWSRVRRTAYLIHQTYRYEYPGPIRDLRQRLAIVPAEQFGDQRRVVHRLEVSVSDHDTVEEQDAFGNTILTIRVPHVAQAIAFEAWIVVERAAAPGPRRLPASVLADPRFLTQTRLTAPDERLRAVAAELSAEDERGLALAEKINAWVYRAMSYAHEITDVHTPAAEALAGGRGVCQDYAHIMLSLCRLCGLPARYVSGHLLGEGGTHAWVDVLIPSDDHPDEAVAVPFDPLHDRRATLSYVTIAVGRDYTDVAPTSGSFTADYPGRLSARKSVGITAVDYEPALSR